MPEERIYTIPLRAARRAPRHRRTPRAVKFVREFLKRHMKSERVKLDEELNRRLWERGIERTSPRIRVRAVKADDGSVEAFLAE
jgi:large subunit ribosomal protein L31e